MDLDNGLGGLHGGWLRPNGQSGQGDDWGHPPGTAIRLASSGAAYPLGGLSTTTMSVSGANCTGMTAWVWVQGSGLLTLTGANGLSGDANTFLGAR